MNTRFFSIKYVQVYKRHGYISLRQVNRIIEHDEVIRMLLATFGCLDDIV